MATHSSILAWEIPWTEGPGGLQPMGSQRVRHDRVAPTPACSGFQVLSCPVWIVSFTAPFCSSFCAVMCVGCETRVPGLGQALHRRACMRTPGLESVSRAEPTARLPGTPGQDPPGSPGGWRPGVQPASRLALLSVFREPPLPHVASVRASRGARLRSVQASLASPLLLLPCFCLPPPSPPLRKLGFYPHWLLSPVSTGPASQMPGSLVLTLSTPCF